MRIGLVGAGRIGAFHAETLTRLPAVSHLVVTDAEPGRADAIAGKFGAGVTTAPDVDALLAGGVDGLLVAAPTAAHAPLIRRAAAAGVPVFCEKPVAAGLADTRAVLAVVAEAGIELHVGFQRRFDAGYAAVREAVADGRLGWLHTLRACTSDPAPPPAGYLPTSGGIFRDCAVHDFDAVRWTTGREITEVYATGANRGDPAFTAAGDVDTGVAVLTLDDGTLATCTATRYNGAGYDVRLEACGSAGTLVAGLGERSPLSSAEPDETRPQAPAYAGFLERFGPAYVAELTAFTEVVAGHRASPCTGADALAAVLAAEAAERSRAERRPVAVAEVS